MRMFVGNHEHTLDEKGRLVMPSAFRGRLAEGAYITVLDECLAIFPEAEFERTAEQMHNDVDAGTMSANALRAYSWAAEHVVPDTQGRVRIVPSLRDAAKLNGRVIVAGMIRRVEVWSPDLWSEIRSRGAAELSEAISAGRGLGNG